MEDPRKELKPDERALITAAQMSPLLAPFREVGKSHYSVGAALVLACERLTRHKLSVT